MCTTRDVEAVGRVEGSGPIDVSRNFGGAVKVEKVPPKEGGPNPHFRVGERRQNVVDGFSDYDSTSRGISVPT